MNETHIYHYHFDVLFFYQEKGVLKSIKHQNNKYRREAKFHININHEMNTNSVEIFIQ